MSKKEQILFYKKELQEIEIQKIVLQQSIQVITRREILIKSALDKLGSSVPTRKGKVLSNEMILKLKANLTK